MHSRILARDKLLLMKYSQKHLWITGVFTYEMQISEAKWEKSFQLEKVDEEYWKLKHHLKYCNFGLWMTNIKDEEK